MNELINKPIHTSDFKRNPTLESSQLMHETRQGGQRPSVQKIHAIDRGPLMSMTPRQNPHALQATPTSNPTMIQMKPVSDAIQMKCAECEEEESIQMRSDGRESFTGNQLASDNIEQQLSNAKGTGMALPSDAQADIGRKIGSDFSSVNIHTDSRSVRMNQELGSQAFTHGKDIYFNQGKYNPASSSGKRLLAHELTHVVQQSGAQPNAIQMMSAADALTVAQSLNRTYPNWLDVLPDCPCTFDEAMADPDVWEDSTSPFTSTYHPGADKDVRTKNGYQTIPDSSHGQQCTYDADGNLITSGPGAGTPDVWTPNTHFWNHQRVDVRTYNALGSNVYVRYWVPNNGNNCEENVGGGSNVALTSTTEANIVAIRDLLYGWTSEADLQNILSILSGVSSPTDMAAIRHDISPLLVSYLSDIGARTRVRVALSRI